MTSGVPAERLSDDDLRQDLLHLNDKRADIERDGTADQKLNHANRTAELEAEFAKRFAPGQADQDGSDPAEANSARADTEPANTGRAEPDPTDPHGKGDEPGAAKATEVAGTDF